MNDVQNWGLYVPSTTNVDVARIAEVNVNSDEFKELLVRLYQTINNMSIALNLKDTGYHLTTEFLTGELLYNVNNDFNNVRPIYRKVIAFGALPAAGTKSVAHGIPAINGAFKMVSIVTAATKPTVAYSYIPVPYASATAVANNLEINVDAVNVNITTGGTDYSAYTSTEVVLRYVKI